MLLLVLSCFSPLFTLNQSSYMGDQLVSNFQFKPELYILPPMWINGVQKEGKNYISKHNMIQYLVLVF